MRKINLYIIEKLKLNKDSKPELVWDDIAKLKNVCDDFVYYHTFFRGTNFKIITDTENNTVTILFRKYIHPKELEKFRDTLAKLAKDCLKRTIIVDADSTDNTLTCRYSADESIDEKLKLNKNIKEEGKADFKKGNTILRVTLSQTSKDACLYLGVSGSGVIGTHPVKFVKKEGDQIFYKGPNGGIYNNDSPTKSYINSNGFFEVYSKENFQPWTAYIIYFKKEDAIDFIQNVCINFKKNKDNIYKYFDKDDDIHLDVLRIIKHEIDIKDLLEELENDRTE
jgi:hypothetical protein